MNRRTFARTLAALIATPLVAMGLVKRGRPPSPELSGTVDLPNSAAVTGSHGPRLFRVYRDRMIGERTDGILFEFRAADADYDWGKAVPKRGDPGWHDMTHDYLKRWT